MNTAPHSRIFTYAGRRSKAPLLLAMLLVLMAPGTASSEMLRILAIGASNTNGKGVGHSRAWPGQLEAMLRHRGYKVQVLNKGVNGNTTSQILQRLPNALGSSTNVAIVAIPLTNDRSAGIDSQANMRAMKSILQQRGVRYVIIERPHTWADGHFQSDKIHFNTAGHQSLAAKLLPKVIPILNAQPGL